MGKEPVNTFWVARFYYSPKLAWGMAAELLATGFLLACLLP